MIGRARFALSIAHLPLPLDSKRVFILGPSHHAYLDGCAITKCASYATPIGDLPIDLEGTLFALCANEGQSADASCETATNALQKTGQFSQMDIGTDEDEHSIEVGA